MRLQSKVLLLITPAIVLPLLVIGWFAYIKLTQTHNEEIFRQVDTAFDQIALQLNAHIEKTKANAVLLANSNLVHTYLLRKDKADRYELIRPALLKLFISYQRAYPEYSEIRLLLPDGHEDVGLTRGDIPNGSKEEGNASYFQKMVATSPAVYTHFFYHPDNHTFSLLVAKSVAFQDPPAGDAATARLSGFDLIPQFSHRTGRSRSYREERLSYDHRCQGQPDPPA
jgi:hypothetical protein